jgi:hypothetical protein
MRLRISGQGCVSDVGWRLDRGLDWFIWTWGNTVELCGTVENIRKFVILNIHAGLLLFRCGRTSFKSTQRELEHLIREEGAGSASCCRSIPTHGHPVYITNHQMLQVVEVVFLNKHNACRYVQQAHQHKPIPNSHTVYTKSIGRFEESGWNCFFPQGNYLSCK